MKQHFVFALALALLPATSAAQTPEQKAELQRREKAAADKKDADALFAVAKWAADRAMPKDSKRLYLAVLKLKPDHSGANEALGNKLFEGKWLPAREADMLQQQAIAAAMTAKGMVESNGVWVAKEHVADALKGIFHHDGERVTKAEYLLLQAGQVRHPATGELIDPAFLDKAKNNWFPVAGGRWVDQKEADTFHSDTQRRWAVRSAYCTILTTLAFEKIEPFRAAIDSACERLHTLLGKTEPTPENRPAVLIASTDSEYRDVGADLGDATSATSAALLAEGGKLDLPSGAKVRGSMCNGSGNYGPYAARHAAAMSFLYGRATDAGATLPLWLLHGAGSLASRFANDSDGKFYGQRQLQRGGLSPLAGFFTAFAIDSEMESDAIAGGTFQAGLMLRFIEAGDAGDAAVAAAWKEVAAGLDRGSGVAEAITKLEAALVAAEPKIRAFLDNYAK
jgi:hypothetical protein